MDKIDILNTIIENAERRIGSYIACGGKDVDNYVLNQIKIIFKATNEINEELDKQNILKI